MQAIGLSTGALVMHAAPAAAHAGHLADAAGHDHWVAGIALGAAVATAAWAILKDRKAKGAQDAAESAESDQDSAQEAEA
ncbi:hypothetical protein GSH16_01180 [Rhodobacteraceae bacterium KN286]|uniref:Uncharacterized protein n=2 Tax=Oceanomicrobium pacificus TaxID=2692916 RepID=A0A6B0TYR2_9RHOB|nr:hypothetical protein [Oceanomicrobium pacificus]